MKKYKISAWMSLAALVLSVVCYFLPFLSIKDYKSVSGMELSLKLFHRFPIAKANSNALENLSISSYSIWLALACLMFIVSAVMLALYLAKEQPRWLNIACVSTIVGFILFGAQLENSNSMVSDFFGRLTQSSEGIGGKLVYQVPDVEGIRTGLGIRLLFVFSLVALVLVLVSKFLQYETVDQSEHLQTPMSIAYRQFKRNKLALLGLAVLAIFLIACFYGPLFSNYALLQTDIDIAQQPPSLQFPFGTDKVGRDIFTRILYGGRISLEIGIVVVLIEIVIGTVVGGFAGYYGGWVDNLLMRLDDIFLALPMLPVVIIIGAVMMDMKVDPSKRIYFVMLILGLLFWPSLARLVRAQILSLREQEYMVAAEALGIRDRHRIFRHLVPNALPNIIVTATLDIGNAILTESALSFLGLGVAAPYPSWGNIINAVNDPNDFALRPWLWIPAGLCILCTVLAINLVGDGLRDAFDPKMKR